jgi:hypothetical protein
VFTVSKKLVLNMLHFPLGFETVSFSTCRIILQANTSFRDPLSLFSNFHTTLGVLCEQVKIC